MGGRMRGRVWELAPLRTGWGVSRAWPPSTPKKYRPGGWVSLEYIPHPSPVGSTPPDVTKTGATSWWGRGK